jgi:hypothetical protein
MPKDLKIVDGAAAGAWIAPRLEGGLGGHVKQQVPSGYDAYVRVLHPATDHEGQFVTWAKVAAALGRTAHRQMQWHKLVGSNNPPEMTGSEWSGGDPSPGELEPRTLAALCDVLAIHAADTAHCFFGLSTIHGGVEDAYPDASQLRWPGRDFVVFSGALEAAHRLGYESEVGFSAFAYIRRPDEPPPPPPDPVHWFSQAPNLIWPADHSWYVASEYDLDSTLVGGSRDLIDAIMASTELETWEMERSDSLQANADRIN